MTITSTACAINNDENDNDNYLENGKVNKATL